MNADILPYYLSAKRWKSLTYYQLRLCSVSTFMEGMFDGARDFR